MREMMEWIAAEADETNGPGEEHKVPRLRTISQTARDRAPLEMTGVKDGVTDTGMVSDFLVHSFPGRKGLTTGDASPVPPGQSEEHNESQNPHSWQHQPAAEHSEDGMGVPIAEMSWEEERERRIYRGRTIRMLRRFMRYSIETGRLPSVFGREFFRTPITPYSFVTFEDRVIFVHDMETSLNKLDEFSRELIARHFLQEHDQEATARLLHCAERTIRTYVPIALDLLSEILLDSGMLDRTFPIREKSCQGGKSDENFVSSCEESKNKF